MFHLKKITSIFLYFIFCFSVNSEVCVRTSIDKPNSEIFYIAVDFKVPTGEHLTAPIGKGKSLAPSMSFENAEIVKEYWPKAEKIHDKDGKETEYSGYSKDFSLIYSVKIKDLKKPVNYDLFYVSCNDSCIPHQEASELKMNGLLLSDEVKNVTGGPVSSPSNLILMVIFGILGGLILNCMPCVFPVISMKIFSIVKSSGASTKTIRKHGIASSIGILSTFIILGISLIIIRQTMPEIGWGFYMQDPKFVFKLLLIFFLCALNFFGIFSFTIPGIRFGKFQIKNIYISSFFSGVLGAFASAACVGPFAGIAIGSALLFGNFIESCLIFTSIGIGVALPFISISVFPEVIKLIPKPGKWLNVFKEFMGFAMLFSCAWLLWILMSQIESTNVLFVILSLISLSMFLWLYGHSRDSKIFKYISIVGLVISISSGIGLVGNNQNSDEVISWTKYSDQVFEDAKIEKTPIFLNFTASWCMNCQFNQRVFDDQDVIDLFKTKGILSIKCDWTNRNEKITNLLKNYNSISVPFYVYYPGGGKDFVILPTILTKSNLIEAINGTKK